MRRAQDRGDGMDFGFSDVGEDRGMDNRTSRKVTSYACSFSIAQFVSSAGGKG